MMMEMEGERGYEILLGMFLLLKIRKPMNMGTPYVHDSYISYAVAEKLNSVSLKGELFFPKHITL